jgi:putative flippase GtrA
MKLDIYQSCTRSEKRDVLNKFWSRNVQSSPRIQQAAFQYGPYAVICLIAVALELGFVIAVTIHRAFVVGLIAVLLEAFTLWSLWWAVLRWRAIKAESN